MPNRESNSFQNQFSDSIIQGKACSELIHLIKPGGKIPSAEKALEVYQNGYVIRLFESLKDRYETIWWVLGSRLFFETCKKYIATQKSASYNISNYGDSFPAYLERTELIHEYPFLPDLARFNQVLTAVFHLSRENPLTPEAFGSLPIGESSVLEFVPSLRFFQSEYCVEKIYSRSKEEQKNEKKSDGPIEWESPQSLLIFKGQEDSIRTLALEDWEWKTIHRLYQRKSISVSLESLSTEAKSITDEQVSSLFSLLAHSGIVTKVR